MRRLLKLHPFLFAIYCSLAIAAANLGQADPASIRAILAFAVAVCGVTLIAIRAFIDDGQKAALIASGIVLLLTSYGHAIRVVESALPRGLSSLLISAIWVAISVAWVFSILRRRSDLYQLTRFFFTFGILVNLFPIYALVTYSRTTGLTDHWIAEYQAHLGATQGLPGLNEQSRASIEDEQKPDIYFIVLDAYARQDVLSEIYLYDNSPFVSALRHRGFLIAEESNSNYAVTEISLASTLNMAHIHELPLRLEQQEVQADQRIIRNAASTLIKHNFTVQFLRSEGYRIITLDGGYGAVYLGESDLFLQSERIEDANFWRFGLEVMILDTPLGSYMAKWLRGSNSPMQAAFDAHRQRVLFSLEELPKVAARPGPKFVYAHIVSPHVPYVFGPNGERIIADDPYTLLNARPGAEENITRYPDQVHYLNGLILDAVDGIVRNSERPAVIILQGDHGSKVYSDSDPHENIQLRLDFPILNAYRLPGVQPDWVHDGVSPVNSFRGLFNTYFGTLLPFAPTPATS